LNSTDDPFTFDRLGVRVPTLIISPYVPKGSVLHGLPDGEPQYEHSSIPATVVHKLLQPTRGWKAPDYLNARDAWARTFEGAFSEATPRTDTPLTLADVPSHRTLYPQSLPLLDGKQKVGMGSFWLFGRVFICVFCVRVDHRTSTNFGDANRRSI
jgi:hypothetical protein